MSVVLTVVYSGIHKAFEDCSLWPLNKQVWKLHWLGSLKVPLRAKISYYIPIHIT
jgi:hypothetical protein